MTRFLLPAFMTIVLLLGLPSVAAAVPATPTYPYGVMEIHRWWNATHERIDPAAARSLTAWLNASVRNYLRALERAERRRELVSRWSGVAACESGGNWSINTGNGYYGGLQFSLSTWRAYGGRGYPHQQSAWYQSTIADRVRVSSGLGHWPRCGSRYG
jgi:Transglycosylase-like domain